MTLSLVFGCVKPPIDTGPTEVAPAVVPKVIQNTGDPVKAAALDVATEKERSIAVQSVAKSELKLLGDAIATLGNPAETGFWAKTSLVKVQTQGRITFETAGTSVNVTLYPRDGEETGVEVSLSALRTLKAPLAGLNTVQIYSAP